MMKKIRKTQILAWILAVLPLVLVAAAYRRLPDTVPMQWGFGGEVGYEPKWHLWITAALGPFLAALFYFLPRFDPKKRNYSKFLDSYVGFQVVMLLFVLMMNSLCVVEGLRPGTLNVAMVVCLTLSLLFVYVGNRMPTFRMNWFCGIKNPWTLSSEKVWTRTHRLAGRMFFAAGLIGCAGAFVPSNAARLALLLIPVLLACMIPTVRSYLWFRAEQRGEL